MLCYYYQNSSDNNNVVFPIIVFLFYVSCAFACCYCSYAEFYDALLIVICSLCDVYYRVFLGHNLHCANHIYIPSWYFFWLLL